RYADLRAAGTDAGDAGPPSASGGWFLSVATTTLTRAQSGGLRRRVGGHQSQIGLRPVAPTHPAATLSISFYIDNNRDTAYVPRKSVFSQSLARWHRRADL